MELEELLIEQLEALGQIRFSNSFGWICTYTGSNLFAGYKIVDNNILLLWLILSPEGYKTSLDEGFVKFGFGKTWAETEIDGADDLPRIIPFIKEAFDYSKVRREIKRLT